MSKKNRKRLGVFESPQLRNACKTLLANIRFASVDEQIKTIAITSSIVDEGKTAVATNLASAIASSGKSVIIIDADMRRRCIGKLLNLHPKCGMYSVLSGQASLKDAIVSTRIPNLYFMDTEPNIPSPPDILSTRRFAALVEKLRDSFDYVVFDTPPVGLFVDGAIVGSLMDGVLFVIRQRQTKRSSISAALQQLKTANARVLGTVLTFCEEEANDYYYAYYTEDGKRVDKSDTGQAPATAVTPEIVSGNIDSWARRTGVDTASRGQRTTSAHSAAGRKTQSTTQKGSMSHARGREGTKPASSKNANPFPSGAFKPAASGVKRAGSHKSAH